MYTKLAWRRILQLHVVISRVMLRFQQLLLPNLLKNWKLSEIDT